MQVRPIAIPGERTSDQMKATPHAQEPLRFRGARAAHALLGPLRTRYPRFVFGLPLAAGEIPIFVFHDVAAEPFARQLEYLRANGYRTLALEEFLDLTVRKSGVRNARQVLLTFDDARLSFYESALPVLRATGSHATLFAPTLWMGAARPAGTERFMSWAQLKECAASGLVDVASHAHRHALVFDSHRLAGFATPALLTRYDIYDWPMLHDDGGDRQGRPAPGTPIYGANPLLSARTRYLESAALREACVSLVERTGVSDFFSRPDCYSRLMELHDSRAGSLRGRYTSDEEFRALVASEFELSRAAFAEHLGFTPTAFAYPWTLGSDLSVQLAKRFGISCLFGVGTDFRRARAVSRRAQMPAFGRTRNDWLELLPGRNRARLLPVLARKLAALAGEQHLAH